MTHPEWLDYAPRTIEYSGEYHLILYEFPPEKSLVTTAALLEGSTWNIIGSGGMRGKWKSSYYKRYAQFMREVREAQQVTKRTRRKKTISLQQAKTNYQNYWRKYNRTAAIALGGFCSFCRTAPCSCDQLYGKLETRKANADTGYAATPSTSH